MYGVRGECHFSEQVQANVHVGVGRFGSDEAKNTKHDKERRMLMRIHTTYKNALLPAGEERATK